MTKLPKAWERELDIQRGLRAKIERLHRLMIGASNARDHILRTGGKGWTHQIGVANLAYDRAWTALRNATQALYARQVVLS